MTPHEIDDEPEEFVTIETLDPFDSVGKIRHDIDPALIAALPPQRREKFVALAAADESMNASEDALRVAIQNVHACSKNEATASDALNAARPRITAQAAAAAASYAHRTGKSMPADPAVEKRIAKAAAVVDKAAAALTRAHIAHQTAKAAAEKSRVAFFDALNAWNAVSGPKPSQKDLVLASAARNAEREAHEQKVTAIAPASRVDQIMKHSRGKVGRALEHPGKSRIPTFRAIPSVR